MSTFPTLSKVLRTAASLMLATVLHAQVEPQLVTTTDTLDVYKSNAGKSNYVAIQDMTTASRSVFEPGIYLTSSGRAAYMDSQALAGGTNPANPLPNLPTPQVGKDLGFIFVLKQTTNEVYLLKWPQSSRYDGASAFYQEGGVAVKGVPYNFDAAWGQANADGTITDTFNMVTAGATDVDTINQITHVRFKILIKSSPATYRTVDLPCPSKIWNSAYGTQALDQILANGIKNYQKHDLNGITYDTWSDTYRTLVNSDGSAPAAKSALANSLPAGYTPIGNFYYTFDFFTWIFNGKYIRNPGGVRGTSFIAAPTSGNYASPSGYAVPQTTADVTVPTRPAGVSTKGIGWANGLSCMTRAMAQKVAAINVYVDKRSGLNWIYRFLDPYADNPDYSEEGGAAKSAATLASSAPNPDQADICYDASRAKWKYLRRLEYEDLTNNATALQKVGPSAWIEDYGATFPNVQTKIHNMSLYDSGNRPNLDPRTPQPWAYALANTYYRVGIEQNKTIFNASSSTCPGRSYVMIFPTVGLTDSFTGSTTSISQDVAEAYVTYTEKGNNLLCKGSVTGNLTAVTGLDPLTQDGFHPGALAAVAAFGETSNNNGDWGAAWEADPSKTRSDLNPGISTFVASVGIPGAYKLGAENNARNPHEALFRVAQWSDPKRKDVGTGYGNWRSANGNPDDYSITETDPTTSQPGKVMYFPSTDATTLERDLATAVAFIVAGSASLSAPATPSTGARTTTQAYFGTFKTSRFPAWSGNLYALGLKRTLDPTTKQELMSFYGSLGEDTIGCYDTLNPNTGVIDTICGLNDFDGHHLWSAFDIFGQYLASDYPVGLTPKTDGVAGTPLAWSDRRVYTYAGGDHASALVNFNESNWSTIRKLIDPTGGLSLTESQVKSFIRFTLGQHRDSAYPTKNRIDVMGDIINSSPLAIELGADNLRDLPKALSTWPTGDNPHVRLILVGTNAGMLHAFGETAYTDANGFVKAKATEAWAFVPPDMLPTMYVAWKKDTVKDWPHRYLVDGNSALWWEDLAPENSPIGNTRVDSNEDAIVIFGMRKGARSTYALSISGKTSDTGTPGAPLFMWRINPPTEDAGSVKSFMGASTGTPSFGYYSTDDTLATRTPVVFLPGGYANDEINQRFRTSGLIKDDQGLGQSILALNPKTGEIIKDWNWTDDAAMGAVPSAVTPLGILPGVPMIHRVYFADMKGNVGVLDSTGTGTGDNKIFRRDSTKLKSMWRSTPRFIYRNSNFRFTTRPEVYVVPGGYPVPITKVDSSTTPNYKPLTVMVSVGSGDWNNPTDANETFASGGSNFDTFPKLANRMFVFADRQDSSDSVNSGGIPDDNLQGLDDISLGATAWATSYSDARVTIGNASYLFLNKSGYYFPLLHGTLTDAYKGQTHDKTLVSPLIKQGILFFSVFNIKGNTGSQCSSNSFTRTFRECDILRPLAIESQVKLTKTVSDTNDLTRNSDSCNGLAFYFNSLASEMTDTGDRVIQGGAVTASGTKTWDSQVGANTPSLQNVKDTAKKRGFKLQNWRVVR